MAMAIALRRIEGLRLYEPMRMQQLFHDSKARERLARGSNQSGKTLCAAVEVAKAVTGQDKSGRYPKENGVCYCVGFDGKHIADPMWKKLSKAGAFKMIRDLGTGEWRAYRPWLAEDKMRKHEAKLAPPLIAPRHIEFIAWEVKKTSQPTMVKLRSGWEIHFYSGNAKPPQGSQIDLAWFDEELSDSEWYAEIAARLLYKQGYFIWSATPQVGSDRLYELHERAEKQVEMKVWPKTVEEFHLTLDDNLHMTDEQKLEYKDKLNQDDLDVRVAGEFTRMYRVFPEFNAKHHEIDYRPIPPSWTRYAAIDPGRQVCAVLFIAVPPPDDLDHEHIFAYDELYLRDCDARRFGEEMKLKCHGQDFQEFYIDPHEAPKHDTGSGRTIEDQYREQLRLQGIRTAVNGYGFTYGNMDVKGGVEAIRAWLRRVPIKQTRINEDRGSTEQLPDAKLYIRYSPLRIIGAKCPMLTWEFKRYKYKTIGNQVTDEPLQKNNHLMDCTRYLCQARPVYVTRSRTARESDVYLAFKRFTKDRSGPGGGMMLGPGSYKG